MWHSSQTKSHALHVILITNQVTRVTRDISHKPRSYALHVTLVTNQITSITCDTRHKPGNMRHIWHSSQTKSQALHVTFVISQVTCVTCEISHKPRSHALHVTLVTNQITYVTRGICHSSPHVTHNRQRRNGCMVCHADSAGLSEYRDMPWRCILQTATVAGLRHHLKFSSQILTHWAHCTDRMLFVRPQGDCSAQRRIRVGQSPVFNLGDLGSIPGQF